MAKSSSRTSTKKIQNLPQLAMHKLEPIESVAESRSKPGTTRRLYSKRKSQLSVFASQPYLQKPHPIDRALPRDAMQDSGVRLNKDRQPCVALRAAKAKRRSLFCLRSQKLVFPMPGYIARQLASDQLADYEKAEILNYAEVYYLGNQSWRTRDYSKPNFGFTDTDGHYLFYQGDHIAYQYSILEVIGQGSFGTVCKAYDYRSRECVAIKVIRNSAAQGQQALHEVTLLKQLAQTRANVVQLRRHFFFRGHMCMVFELLGASLYEALRMRGFVGFDLDRVASFGKEILTTLTSLHMHSIIHCDLKPENILMAADTVKVIDFGSACYATKTVLSYVQSRYYRAPEILLGLKASPAADMWSFGCILFELRTGRPLFPGNCEQEMLDLMVHVLGRPPEYLLLQITRQDLVVRQPVSVAGVGGLLPEEPWMVIDLIISCLDWNPQTRITPEEALSHPFFLRVSS